MYLSIVTKCGVTDIEIFFSLRKRLDQGRLKKADLVNQSILSHDNPYANEITSVDCFET